MKKASPLRSTSLIEDPLSVTDWAADRVTVGTVGKPHGLDGTVVVHSETDNPARFVAGASLHLDSGLALTVRKVRTGGGILLVSFAGIDDRDGAENLRGRTMWIDSSERRPLEDDEFWPEDLVGLEVRDPSGALIGSVADVDADAPQTFLTVATSEGEFLVPLVTALIPRVDLAAGYLVVEPIDGL